jgi:hypothetical protein
VEWWYPKSASDQPHFKSAVQQVGTRLDQFHLWTISGLPIMFWTWCTKLITYFLFILKVFNANVYISVNYYVLRANTGLAQPLVF